MDRWCLTALQQQSTLPFDKPEESKPGYIRKKKKKNKYKTVSFSGTGELP